SQNDLKCLLQLGIRLDRRLVWNLGLVGELEEEYEDREEDLSL
ncbi:unnamed protein product, partial [Brassica rapa subsp. narinosa]